ncbi:DUF290 domain containing protein [Trichuris trichiura]|uniref:DUF290 domain containing protein n=1 Tax=Trichuris trichiura TaxID=36087 RepID=A0A077Z5X5_TRITR|nr:DUF290 domain containing protein [Trichuris trichiura]
MRKVLFILSLFYFAGLIQCAQKCVEATGKLYCRRNPAALTTAEVRLYDRDGRGLLQVFDPDDLMGLVGIYSLPADDGTFKIHGCGDDADWVPSVPNLPDPYVQIRHSCKSPQGDILELHKGIKFFPEKTELGIIDLDY